VVVASLVPPPDAARGDTQTAVASLACERAVRRDGPVVISGSRAPDHGMRKGHLMSHSSSTRARGRSLRALRRSLAAACGGILVTAAGLAGAGLAGAAPAPAPAWDGQEVSPAQARAKIRPAVTEELRAQGDATVLVRFADRPDLASFEGISSWEERGQAVYDALVATAERSQADARVQLDAAGVDYRSFVVSNAILVQAGDQDLLTSLAGDPEVEGVYLPTRYEAPDPVVKDAGFAPAALGWGVADINADDVWTRLGVDGEGIVVGSIDTGVDHLHPALRRHYRGTNADGSFSHDHNWFDAAGESRSAPRDSDGHGTHTTGTMVGGDGAGNQIGVAPGARWIAANGCCPSDEALLASAEWMLAPTTRAGTRPRPGLRPHVVNNSWGSIEPSSSPFLADVSRAWAAAGMFAVFANGNLGPGCATSASPGSLVANYSVGAYGAGHAIAPSSSRGAGQGGEIKPNISAPGVEIRSAVPGGGYAYATGTSMAAPHVAGAVALLWAAAPELVGDVDATRALLDGAAVDSPDTRCGGTAADNNVFGEGRLDALALLTAAGVRATEVVRVAGPDRYATAARVADHFAPGVDTVLVASGAIFTDALGAAARAGSLGGPVLLVRRDGVPDVTREQLARLRPANVVIAGGPATVSTATERELRSIAPQAAVTRRSGADRYEVAASLAADVAASDVVFVASGLVYPDGLTGAALAGSMDAPVLLVRTAQVPPATRAQLERLSPREIVVLGGPATVRGTVLEELSAYGQVRRISGADRYEVAASVAASWTTAEEAYVASGLVWPDALAGAARAAATGSPLLLVRTADVPDVTGSQLRRLAPGRVLVLGGRITVGDPVLARVRTVR
jgi:putative cell wall-binding protein